MTEKIGKYACIINSIILAIMVWKWPQQSGFKQAELARCNQHDANRDRSLDMIKALMERSIDAAKRGQIESALTLHLIGQGEYFRVFGKFSGEKE